MCCIVVIVTYSASVSNPSTCVLTFHMWNRVSHFIVTLFLGQISDLLVKVVTWCPIPLAASHKDLHIFVGCTVGMVVYYLLNNWFINFHSACFSCKCSGHRAYCQSLLLMQWVHWEFLASLARSTFLRSQASRFLQIVQYRHLHPSPNVQWSVGIQKLFLLQSLFVKFAKIFFLHFVSHQHLQMFLRGISWTVQNCWIYPWCPGSVFCIGSPGSCK